MRIEYHAAMAKLSLSETGRTKVSVKAEALIESSGALENIKTDHIYIQVTMLDIRNIFQDDVESKSVQRGIILSNVPEQYGGYFQVPKTLD